MAARKIRQPPAAVCASPSPPGSASETGATPPAPAEDAAGASRRLWLWPAVLLFAFWFVVLFTLALRTANPVTLNRAQIRSADLVVEARVEKLASGECRVVRAWPEAPQLGPVITVAGLGDLAVRPGRTYLLPLQRSDREAGFRIAPSPLGASKPLIYPADDETRRQLNEILGPSQTDPSETGD